MEYDEEDYLQLSGIQHYEFCKRQWALIHIEQQWQENVHTVEGNLLHKKAHNPLSYEKRGEVLTVRGLRIHSRQLGFSGECDVVEFHEDREGIRLSGHRGLYRPYPVEYKKGSPKITDADISQLAAQAMCLEEMFCIPVCEGALYYGEIRRRERAVIDDTLKDKVKEIAADMHRMYERKYTPRVRWTKGCSACSLKDICLPRMGKGSSVGTYIDDTLKEGVE